jgi:trans-aconitate 2-methyltransferase
MSIDGSFNDQTDLNAVHYVKHSALQNNLATNILRNYPINPNADILDVGCGDGRITAMLSKEAHQGNVIGLDASPNMIDFALKNFPKTNFPNLSFCLGMIEEVKFDQPFDLIVSFSCFHWLRDPRKTIEQLLSSLKKDGEILILTYPKESQYYQYLETALHKYPEYRFLSANNTMLTASQYKAFFFHNQLNVLDFQEMKLFAYYNSSAEIVEYIKGWVNNYVQLPEHLYAPFINDVVDAMIKDPLTHQEQKIGIPYTALVMRLKK